MRWEGNRVYYGDGPMDFYGFPAGADVLGVELKEKGRDLLVTTEKGQFIICLWQYPHHAIFRYIDNPLNHSLSEELPEKENKFSVTCLKCGTTELITEEYYNQKKEIKLYSRDSGIKIECCNCGNKAD